MAEVRDEVEPLVAGGVRITYHVAARVLRDAGLRSVGERTLVYDQNKALDEEMPIVAYPMLVA
jgi:hypothetical protein